jgi:predicted DNA-binding transcriptional regulator AlpA
MATNDIPECVQVLAERAAIKAAGVSEKTWKRLKARGETPPVTRLSPGRIGYRVADLAAWLDARREQPA